MNRRAALIFAIAMLCAGCAAESHDELIAETQRLALTGAPVEEARAALVSVGFDCGTSGGYLLAGRPDIKMSCGRQESLFLAGCSQHLYLILDAQNARVARVEVTGPYCAGL